MTTDIDPYWGRQMELFPGGYRHVMVEMTMHLHGNGSTVPVGVVVTDHASGQMVGALIPTFTIDLADPRGGVYELLALLDYLQVHMAPF